MFYSFELFEYLLVRLLW